MEVGQIWGQFGGKKNDQKINQKSMLNLIGEERGPEKVEYSKFWTHFGGRRPPRRIKDPQSKI